MKFSPRQRKSVRRLLQMVEPHQLLSARFLTVIGLGTTSPQGVTITAMGADDLRRLRTL